MSGTYVTKNGTGEFEIRPFQLEEVCQLNGGHSHNYDHWMLVERGAIQIEVRESEDGPVIRTEQHDADDPKLISATRFNGEVEMFHAFVAAPLFHTIKATKPNTQYECCFLHRDFETGEVVQSYNGNPLASS